jgi:hypothetical protein
MAAIAVFFVFAAALASTAEAAPSAAWWGLTTGTRPSPLQAGLGKSEVQELTLVENASVDLTIEGVSVGKVGTGTTVGGEVEAATAANVQAFLEAEAAYGAGNVEVTGGPGGVSPLLIISRGEDVDKPVPPMQAELIVGGNENHSTVVTTGRADGVIVVTAENRGSAPTSGEVQITDHVQSGLKPVEASGVAGFKIGKFGLAGSVECTVASAKGEVTCTFEGTLMPYAVIEVVISVAVLEGASAEVGNEASVSGGGAAEQVTNGRSLAVGGDLGYGVQEAQFRAENADGTTDTQAGSHPYQLTSVVTFDQTSEPGAQPVHLPKDIGVVSPSGLVGNPTPFAKCTDVQFGVILEEGFGFAPSCPSAAQVGVAAVTFNEPAILGLVTLQEPIYNMVPERGEPARFGFYVLKFPVFLNAAVRTGGDYGVTVTSHNTIEAAGLLSVAVTLWGVPGDSAHNPQRGAECLGPFGCGAGSGGEEASPSPFLSMPTSCTGPLQASVQTNSWTDPGDLLSVGLAEPVPGMDGCNHLPFSPEVSVAPDVQNAASPSGLTVRVHLPQSADLNAEGLGESTLKDTTVRLPAGVTLNAGGAGGLAACTEGEIGYEGHETPGEAAVEAFSPILAQPFCPDSSKIGTVDIETPLLPNPLTGAVYLASPAPAGEAGQNPFRKLVAMYIVAEDPVSGVLVKLPGEVLLCEAAGEALAGATCQVPGQVIARFKDTPQLPFENFSLQFFGGGRAPLATPALCGSYTTQAVFTPWSGNPPVTSTSTFQITSGPNGSACPSSPRPFTPELNVGTTNNQAGAFSELRTTMGHPDEDQELGGLKMTLPPGLVGTLSTVKLCGEPQASEGTCGPESLIGHTTVTAGLGSTPAVVPRPGNVYITGPYDGAPYGLSIANPAETGPFDLEKGTKCDCIVVRAKIEVDPRTTQLTITSDPLPQTIDGIPLDLQHVSVQIDRPGFTFNPTSCAKMKIEASMSGSEGASAPIAVPFQATNCASLAFKPTLTASTAGKTSRKRGASLHVSLTYPKEALGKDANIHEVKVELPKALPSRLSTLQKACTQAQFEANPAGCPAASVVGHAKALTPILPVPLEGPAYFVSYGSAKFPELVLDLQGYGITIDLHGETFISKAGITSSTFRTVPDAPVQSFELTLPEGKDSALAANKDLCATRLVMPTSFVAQNGATVAQKTKIKVTGCSAARKKSKKKGKGEKKHQPKKHKAKR